MYTQCTPEYGTVVESRPARHHLVRGPSAPIAAALVAGHSPTAPWAAWPLAAQEAAAPLAALIAA